MICLIVCSHDNLIAMNFIIIIIIVCATVTTGNHDKDDRKQFNYNEFFSNQIQAKMKDKTYRKFRILAREPGVEPTAKHFIDPTIPIDQGRDITVWCSNDYLGMGKHPDVVESTM